MMLGEAHRLDPIADDQIAVSYVLWRHTLSSPKSARSAPALPRATLSAITLSFPATAMPKRALSRTSLCRISEPTKVSGRRASVCGVE